MWFQMQSLNVNQHDVTLSLTSNFYDPTVDLFKLVAQGANSPTAIDEEEKEEEKEKEEENTWGGGRVRQMSQAPHHPLPPHLTLGV